MDHIHKHDEENGQFTQYNKVPLLTYFWPNICNFADCVYLYGLYNVEYTTLYIICVVSCAVIVFSTSLVSVYVQCHCMTDYIHVLYITYCCRYKLLYPTMHTMCISVYSSMYSETHL